MSVDLRDLLKQAAELDKALEVKETTLSEVKEAFKALYQGVELFEIPHPRIGGPNSFVAPIPIDRLRHLADILGVPFNR